MKNNDDKYSFNSKNKEYPIHFHWQGLINITLDQAKKIRKSLDTAITKTEEAKKLACRKCGHNLGHMKVKGPVSALLVPGKSFDIKCPKCKTVHAIEVKL